MKFIDRKGMVSAIYCMMIMDRDIKKNEILKFDEIGIDIDGEEFINNKEIVTKECEEYIQPYKDDEFYYDVLAEFIDSKIYSADPKERVSSRFVIWNLLAIAYCDGIFDETERRFIKHISRMLDLPDVVFMELEQHMKACLDIHNELEWLEQSDRPYKEIRLQVDQMESRQKVLLESVANLIEDEVYEYEHYGKIEEPKEKSIAVQTFENTTSFISNKTGEVVSNVQTTFNDKVAPVATTAGESIMSGIKMPVKFLVKKTSTALQQAASNLDNKEEK